MKLAAQVLALAASAFFTGCSSNEPKKTPGPAEDVNKQHIKGTTDVLRNYRYGEPPTGAKKSK